MSFLLQSFLEFDFDNMMNLEPTKDLRLEYSFPGVKKNEISVTYENDTLIIAVDSKRMKRKIEQRIPSKYYNIDKIDVKYEDGLMEITVPLLKTEDRKDVKKIEIKGG